MSEKNDYNMNSGNNGYLCMVLHAHLPYIRHPEHDYFLEENWLYEAITETYIPLIQMFEKLVKDEVDFRITMSMSPTLLSMLIDELLQSRYVRHIEKLIELSEKEIKRTNKDPDLNILAKNYNAMFNDTREIFVNSYKHNLVTAFKKFQDLGRLEIVTSTATHAYLPLMQDNHVAVKAQIQIAVDFYESIFERKPIGFWLPECGFYPGVDELLKDVGIQYFFVETHGITNASAKPKYGVYAPVYCPSGVAAFGRDSESSKRVWSASEGYPGDFAYRDYYRDIGHELDDEYIAPYIHPDGIRLSTGIKYWRITGKSVDTRDKKLYSLDSAQKVVDNHATDFMIKKQVQIDNLFSTMDRKPVIVAKYDAELFGHWWFEGPKWLDSFIRKIAFDQNKIRLITPSEYLKEYSINQVAVPSTSSWGCRGYNEVWINPSNDWIYKHLNRIVDCMIEAANKFKNSNGVVQRALNQAAREVLLAQSSDWAFIMNTGTFVGYAEKRTKEHVTKFHKLYRDVSDSNIDEEWLSNIEKKWNIFSEIDFRVFCRDG